MTVQQKNLCILHRHLFGMVGPHVCQSSMSLLIIRNGLNMLNLYFVQKCIFRVQMHKNNCVHVKYPIQFSGIH